MAQGGGMLGASTYRVTSHEEREATESTPNDPTETLRNMLCGHAPHNMKKAAAITAMPPARRITMPKCVRWQQIPVAPS